MRNERGITLVALVITIIILLILAGITITQLTQNNLLKSTKEAKEKTENAQSKENEILLSYQNQIENLESSSRDNNNLYQKLRSDVSIDVQFTDEGKFVAPTDGYYILSTTTFNCTGDYQCYVRHYLENDTFIESYHTSGYHYKSWDGCNIYMKKGEYLLFTKERNCTVNSSKFWYAEGCVPNN